MTASLAVVDILAHNRRDRLDVTTEGVCSKWLTRDSTGLGTESVE